MAIDTTVTRSRRALLAAAGGGLAALAARALGAPTVTRAADGAIVKVGGSFTGTSTTRISDHANPATVFWADTVEGLGILGTSETGNGVVGDSVAGAGVFGHSSEHAGVEGSSEGSAGVLGHTIEGTGVFGYSGSPVTVPAIPAKTGVYGRATQDGGSRGVHGYSTAGRGVYGQATSGWGVYGYAGSGVGGHFAAGSTGTALRVDGRVRFSTAGSATIPAGAYSVPVTPGLDLTASSLVLATLQANGGGSCAVERVEIDTAANTFRVHVTAPPTVAVRVAWFVIG